MLRFLVAVCLVISAGALALAAVSAAWNTLSIATANGFGANVGAGTAELFTTVEGLIAGQAGQLVRAPDAAVTGAKLVGLDTQQLGAVNAQQSVLEAIGTLAANAHLGPQWSAAQSDIGNTNLIANTTDEKSLFDPEFTRGSLTFAKNRPGFAVKMEFVFLMDLNDDFTLRVKSNGQEIGNLVHNSPSQLDNQFVTCTITTQSRTDNDGLFTFIAFTAGETQKSGTLVENVWTAENTLDVTGEFEIATGTSLTVEALVVTCSGA